MKKIFSNIFAAMLGTVLLTGCIQEFDPQTSTVTSNQAGNAPGSYNNFVKTLTSTLAGSFYYGNSSGNVWDFGYPSFLIQRDVMGQDMIAGGANNWFSSWYECSRALGPQYAVCQVPWTYYYKWIKNCNTVLSLAGETPAEDKKAGAGIAYAMRAMFYMDIARMFSQKTYAQDKEALTVPIITEATQLSELSDNPRATNEKMWEFILSDLDKAEELIKDYKREDKYTPDLSVVYGFKARAYLTMEDWANAEKYAKLAMAGYNVMDEATYTSRDEGFNTPNDSWMFATHYKSDDPCILENDGDSSWGSVMCLEVDPKTSGCGYASSYGGAMTIDRHLYETMPATDFRKKCFIDFSIDNLPTEAAMENALSAYSDYTASLISTAGSQGTDEVGGLSLKFRLAGGAEGRANQKVGFCVAVPLMRVEEMKLIEAEAAGMQDLSRGISLLTAFAKTRDASYTYGTHTDSYYNVSTSAFQNECWWQRRVELWGEGFATFDIKRLNKGIIRSYANSNHVADYSWNVQTPPDWMTLCIVGTEVDYNKGCVQNPIPVAPASPSDQYVW